VPVLGIASCILLLTQQRPLVWLFAAALLAVGVLLYFVSQSLTVWKPAKGSP
jgi:hypothetical protein